MLNTKIWLFSSCIFFGMKHFNFLEYYCHKNASFCRFAVSLSFNFLKLKCSLIVMLPVWWFFLKGSIVLLSFISVQRCSDLLHCWCQFTVQRASSKINVEYLPVILYSIQQKANQILGLTLVFTVFIVTVRHCFNRWGRAKALYSLFVPLINREHVLIYVTASFYQHRKLFPSLGLCAWFSCYLKCLFSSLFWWCVFLIFGIWALESFSLKNLILDSPSP